MGESLAVTAGGRHIPAREASMGPAELPGSEHSNTCLGRSKFSAHPRSRPRRETARLSGTADLAGATRPVRRGGAGLHARGQAGDTTLEQRVPHQTPISSTPSSMRQTENQLYILLLWHRTSAHPTQPEAIVRSPPRPDTLGG
jgi:hypothetical protein